MSVPPASPKIYHITRVGHLVSIAADGALFSDARMIAAGKAYTSIGIADIKGARLQRPVDCHPNTYVGEYVPFYFCPRSVMLYVIHKANHPGLDYRGGQEPIVHLEADLHAVIAWATGQGRRWAFSVSNARAGYTTFRADPTALNEINWAAVATTDWRPSEIKEAKQAEFLIYDDFPWSLVERIGVIDQTRRVAADAAIRDADHRPPIVIKRNWYY